MRRLLFLKYHWRFVLRDSESASQDDNESSNEENPQNENDAASKGGTTSVKRYKANCQN